MSQKNYSSNYSTANTNPKSKGLESQYSSNSSAKDDIQELKRKAQEAHLKMQKRKRAAIKIQKIARGYIARRKFEKLKRKLRLEYEERLRMQKLKEYFIQKAPEIICNAIYTYICKKRYKEKLMLRKYINHCAVMIQANIRGVLTRKKYKVAIQHRRLFLELLNDIVKAWKTRKCFKHRACKRIVMEIRELEHFEKEDDEGFPLYKIDFLEGGEKFRKSISAKLRSKKIELLKVFRVIYNQGVWMYKYTPDVSPVQTSKHDDFYRSRNEESYHDDPNESASQVSRALNDDFDNRPIRGRGSASRNDEPRLSRNSGPNAWEERENRPIGGSKSRNWTEEQEYAPSRGSRKPTISEVNERDSFISRGKRRAQSNAYEERENMPIGGNRGPNQYDERENMPVGKRGALNPYEERENMPVGMKKAGSRANFDEESSPGGRFKKRNNDPDDRPIKPSKVALDEYPPEVEAEEANNDEEENHDDEARKKPKSGAFLKKKQKYDPRKAIEEAKKNTEISQATVYKNKKSEQLRNAIKAARGVQDDEKSPELGVQPPEAKSKKKVALAVPDDQTEEENPNVGEDRSQTAEQKERKHNFLKRKSKAMEQQKLDWKTTPSRIDCWGKKEGEMSRSPDRAKSKGRVNVPKITKITKPQEHESQKNSPRPRTAPKEEPKRTQMKSPDNKRPGTQAGRKESPPKKKKTTTQVSQNANHQIKLEDLEKAYTANFLGKYNNLTEKFYSENGARDIKYEYNSIVPIIRQDSLFFKQYDSKNYHNALMELDQEYQSLQTIS